MLKAGSSAGLIDSHLTVFLPHSKGEGGGASIQELKDWGNSVQLKLEFGDGELEADWLQKDDAGTQSFADWTSGMKG